MTKKELTEEVAEALASQGRQHITKTQVEAVLDALGGVATKKLAAGGEVPLPGIGRVVVERRKARTGRNPRTGAPVDVPAKRVAKLNSGKDLKTALNPQTA